ncbi:site-specific DNA-methyltransferase [Cruoricaptor ignavus]|uniref:site-specific DNA-methyltransferase n=1 Tax=Cruoricaptor ignavus TaxID=1118202 RepID=UPI00370D2482
MIQDILANNDNIHSNDKQMAVLKEYFPACFSKDGAFDIERFKEEIKDKTDITAEGYELKFLGKSYAKLLASTETTTVIVPDEEHNQKPENKNSENIYISGDNLDGLKHLLHSYQKKIKCIYIDPPYNTGSDGFVYNDSFNYTSEELQEKLSIGEKEAQRILDLTKRGSASHSAWLMFMYPRLLLARDLMTDDGVIFISIDDNEQANLKLLCDDIFGEENFIAELIWKKKNVVQNDAKYFSTDHEYLISYCKKTENINLNRVERTEEQISRYTNPDNDPRGPWTSVALQAKSGNSTYEITFDNGVSWKPVSGTYPRLSYESLKNAYEDNRLWFGKKGKNVPRLKKFLNEVSEGVILNSIWFNEEVGSTQRAKETVKALFEGKNLFDTPKPIELISRILKLSTSAKNSNEFEIVLDFFSGSASTAHAVLKLNAEDGGNRKFIAVQLPEALCESESTQIEAYNFLKENKYPTTLDYIGIERIKRAAAKIKEENPDKALDLGFKHFTLQEPEQNTLDKLERFDKSALIADTTVLDDFGAETVLATWLNDDGYDLTATAEETDLAGYKAYYKDKHLYFIYPGFTQEALQALITRFDTDGSFNPENIVLFGYSFPDWSVNEMLEKNLKILNDSEKNLKINYAVRY